MKTYRVTATGIIKAETPSLARELFSERIDMDALPCDVDFSAEEENAKPHIGPNHPCALAAHAINNILQAGVSLEEVEDTEFTHLAGTMILERGGEALEQIAMALQLIEHQERLIEEQRVQLLTEQRQFARIDAINTRLVDQHNRARAMGQALTECLRALPLTPDAFARPMSVESPLRLAKS